MDIESTLDLTVSMLKRFEGLRLHAYQDVVGVYTIGYGFAMGVHKGDVWTAQEAEDRLRECAAGFMLKVFMSCPQLQDEPIERAAACVSLAYNIGSGAFGASSVRRYTSRGEYAMAADSFLNWRFAGGRPILLMRRKAERDIYLSPHPK